ncbi:MAG TPA: lysophospholipid acyltransferase family protein [Chitinophagales bacterium]|nr:lysophospholipid acyltransferase family protein [Chitinophagales bacterium]
MRTVLRFFFTVWAYFTFILLMLLAFIYHVIVMTVTRGKGIELMYKCYRPWSYTWALLNGAGIIVKGEENFQWNKSHIFVSNHGSTGDMIIVAAAMRGRFRPLGKVETKRIPIMGYIFSRALVTVDRSNPESRRASMEKMREMIKQGISILIMPEGTRNRTDKPLQPFHDGAFRLAIEFQLPIIPMILLNTRKLYPNDTWLMNPSNLECHFLKPVPTEGLTEKNVQDLKVSIFRLMEDYIIHHDEQFAHLRNLPRRS